MNVFPQETLPVWWLECLRPLVHIRKSLKDFHSYLAEAQKGEHGEDGRCQRKDQEMFADAVPLKTSMHQERYQAKRCRGLQTTGQQSSLGHNS